MKKYFLSIKEQWCDFCVSNLLLTACRQPKRANVCKTQKYKMFNVSRKYGLWPLIRIVMKWGSQWCDFCASNLLLTACRQPKRANVCKITKSTKCSPLVESAADTEHLYRDTSLCDVPFFTNNNIDTSQLFSTNLNVLYKAKLTGCINAGTLCHQDH